MATKYECVMAEIECAMAVESWMARVQRECDAADAMVRRLYTNIADDGSVDVDVSDLEVR